MEENYMYELENIKRRNKYFIFIGVILILIAIGFCLFLDWNRRVKEPIMLPVCMEVYSGIADPNENLGQARIQLYYITDYKFNNSVIGITFPEKPELMCYGGELYNYYFYSDDNIYFNDNTNEWRQYGRYQIHQINVEFISVPLEEDIKLTKAELLWKNGKHTMVDIGIVNLYNNNYDQSSLQSHYASSTSGRTSVEGLDVMEDTTIESIESPLLPYIDGKYTFDINGIPYQVSGINNLDLVFKKGDYIEITINKNDLMNKKFNPYYFVDIRPKVLFKEKNGKQAYVWLYGLRESLEYKLSSEKKIYQYIKEREKNE